MVTRSKDVMKNRQPKTSPFKTFLRNAGLVAACAGLISACSGMARSPERYRDDTRAAIESRNPEIKSCYDRALETDAGVQGTVVVNFTVEKKTGEFKEVAYDQQETTAPESIAMCVVETLQGMTLDPADQRDGQATFRWEFSPSS